MTTIARTRPRAPSDLPAYVAGADLTAHDIDEDYVRRLRRLTRLELDAEVFDTDSETARWKERIAAYLRPSRPADAVARTSTRIRLPLSDAPVTPELVGLVNAYNAAHSRLVEALSEQAQRSSSV